MACNRVIAFDSETSLIRPAQQAPALACVTYESAGSSPQIVDSLGARERIAEWLSDPGALLVGHNVAYDAAVICEAYPDLRGAVFAAYDEDRVTDTMLRQKLLDIAAGMLGGRVNGAGFWIVHRYDLATVANKMCGLQLQKDAWRLSYGSFVGVPLADWSDKAIEVQAAARVELASLTTAWSGYKDVPSSVTARMQGLREQINGDPSRCTRYPLEDAAATLAVYHAQEAAAYYLHDQFRQARAAFWLHLSSIWGLRTDGLGIEVFRREVCAEYEDLRRALADVGLVRADGTRDTKLAKAWMLRVCREERMPIRRTEGHFKKGAPSKCRSLDGTILPCGDEACVEHVCLDAESCATTGDAVLVDYAQFSTLSKVLSTDIDRVLALGATYPIHPRYGLAETGRTTCAGPNIQNLRRKAGIREAFVPRAGRVFAQADYPTLELFTLAQCCVSWIGFSRLADALNAGVDPHLRLCAQLLRITYEEAVTRAEEPEIQRARHLAKAANFGFPGGMGAAKMLATTRRQMILESSSYEEGLAAWRALDLTEERARDLKEQWLAAWPELPHYFARVDAAEGRVESLFTARHRGCATYCAAANTGFQGLASDCAKEAGWRICKAQYTQPESPLFDSRTVAFVHDEFVLECDGSRGHDVANALADLMCEGANVYLPDVRIPRSRLKPLLMRRWAKKAKPVYGADGRLVPFG